MNKEVFSLPSKTVPGQTKNIRQILVDFQRGNLTDVNQKQPLYEDNPDIDNPNPFLNQDLDLVEMDIFAQENKARILKLTDEVQTQRKEAIKKYKEQQVAQAKALLKELQIDEPTK